MDKNVVKPILTDVEQGALFSLRLEEIAAQGPLFSDEEDYIPDPELQ